jgi:MFS family permease
MKKVSIKAVVLAGIFDVVLTNLLAIPVLVIDGIRIEIWKLPKNQQAQAMLDAFQSNSGIYTAGLILGALASIIAGYIAARIARREPLLNGALSAWLCVASGVYAMVQPNSPLPVWAHLLFLPLSPAFGAIGGYWWMERASRRSGTGPATAPVT